MPDRPAVRHATALHAIADDRLRQGLLDACAHLENLCRVLGQSQPCSKTGVDGRIPRTSERQRRPEDEAASALAQGVAWGAHFCLTPECNARWAIELERRLAWSHIHDLEGLQQGAGCRNVA